MTLDVACERCETNHLPDAPCAPLQLCPVCGRNGGGVPCGHYDDEIYAGLEAGNLLE
jgi:hypothetical protein